MNNNVEFSLDSQKETAGESENNKMKWYASAQAHLKEGSAVHTVLLKPVKCQITLQNHVFKERFLVTPTVPATSNIDSIFLLHTEPVMNKLLQSAARCWFLSNYSPDRSNVSAATHFY